MIEFISGAVFGLLLGFLLSAFFVAGAEGSDTECTEPFTAQDIIKQQQEIINRQKAEIERLKAEDEMAEGYARALIEKTEEEVEVAKAEAVKEFVEKFKNATKPIEIDGKVKYQAITFDTIDNLVKEMVGEG